jgi:hypothetical protein
MGKRAKVKYEKDINFVIHGEVQRPWGYEVRVAIFDDSGKHVDSACITWPRNYGVPDDGERLSKVMLKIMSYKERRDNPDPEPVPKRAMDEDDILAFLVGRGYLTEGQVLNDLPDLIPGTVETPVWRRVWDFLNRPLWGE